MKEEEDMSDIMAVHMYVRAQNRVPVWIHSLQRYSKDP